MTRCRRLMQLTIMLAMITPAVAATGLPGSGQDSKKPIEITAQQTIEWLRDKKQYIARGDVLVVQGAVSIRSDLLEADYRETGDNNFDIYRMTATGGVHIASGDNVAQGEKAVYEIDKSLATMTGGDLRLSGPGQTVTAGERFEYWVNESRLIAIGGSKAVRGDDTITADRITAVFKDDPKTGNRSLNRMESNGHVVITTPAEVLTGDTAVYNANTTVAEIHGNVVVTRGQNRLMGDSADVNMTTNVSRMHGGGSGDNARVRGIFYPGSEKTPGATISSSAKPSATP